MAEPLVIGNWKMHTNLDEAVGLARAVGEGIAGVAGVEVVVCPPFPWLLEVARALEGLGVAVGAQNAHYEDRGGFTGEVSAWMLRGVCRYVLLGHSERRVQLRESDWMVNQKVLAAIRNGLVPVLCVVETADQLDAGETDLVVGQQVENCLKGVPPGTELVIAYDPVWTTMGLVTPPSPDHGNETCGCIRETLGALWNPAASEVVRVIYGGPVTTRNAGALAVQPEINGLLVGGASLRAEDFVEVALTVARSART